MNQIKIKSFATSMEAELAKSMLRAHGIQSFTFQRGVHSSGIPDDLLGVELMVLEKDVERAREILEASAE